MENSYLFIHNPISGGKRNNFISIFEHQKALFPNAKVITTTHKGHAIKLVKQHRNGFDIIVAVGGDGTINEVASALINTTTPMGIISQGSGNGFANHLGISNNSEKALQQLISGKEKEIDIVYFNNKSFVNVAGIGFDGHIAALFDNSKRRGFLSYARLVLAEFFAYKEFNYSLKIGTKIIKDKAFIIALANSNQYGNHFYIAPKAKSNDGLLNVMMFKKPSLFSAPIIIWRMFKGRDISPTYCTELVCNELLIECSTQATHIDGEVFINDESNQIHLKVMEKSLRVIC